MTPPENLILPDRCLAVYVDDTGHEALMPGHSVYGLGGCAVMGRDLDRLILQPWREIRKRVAGSPDMPLYEGSGRLAFGASQEVLTVNGSYADVGATFANNHGP